MTAAPAETEPSTRFAEVPAKQLVPHPKNVRVDVGDVTDLAASIKTQGVLQPLVVAPLPKARHERWVVIAGHRRLAASKRAGLTVLPCVVREDLVDEAAQLQAMLVENGQRTDLTPVEEGDAYRALTLDYGVPVKDLAKNIGRSQQLVRGRIALAGSPDSVRTRVIAGQVPIEQAIELATFDDVPEVHDGLAKSLGTSNWSWALQDARSARDGAKKYAKDLRDLERAQTRRIEERPDGERVATLDDLTEAASEQAFTVALDAQGEDVPEEVAEAAASAAAAKARAAFTVEAHATCPGHCAYVKDSQEGTYSGWRPGYVQHCCDQVALHANATGWEPTPANDDDAETARAEAARREEVEREQREALAVAATVRRRHLGTVAARSTEASATAWLVERIAGHVAGSEPRDVTAFAEVLGVDLTPSTAYNHQEENYEAFRERRRVTKEAQHAEVTAALADRPLLELVGLLDVAIRCVEHDGDLIAASSWTWDRARAHLQALAASGYEWSPVERAFLPAGVAADTPLPS